MSSSQPYTILDDVRVRTITSSTDATPIVLTVGSGHGLVDGDRITVNGHTTNTNANGTWDITVSTNAITLVDSVGTGAGAGGNDGAFAIAAKIIFTDGFKNCNLTFDTDGNGDAAMTVKAVISDQEDSPDFAAPKTATNRYEFVYMSDYENPAADNIPGDTGFVVAGGDDNRMLKVNTDGQRWLSVLPTAGTEGEITVTTRLFNNQ